MVKKSIPFILILILTIFSSKSLLHPGFIPTHDGEYHVMRFYEFDKALHDGDLYPRWAKDFNFGYGIPLFNYVYPLPNYISSLIHQFSISFIDSFKLSLLLASIIGALSIYAWAKQFWNSGGGFMAAVFYIFSPYRLLDVYIRGSVGEVWALAFFPAFLWSVTKLIKKSDKKHIYISGVLLACTILSHNILAVMFTSFAFLYSLFLLRFYNRRNIVQLLTVFLYGIGLSAIFWFPALLEKGLVVGLEIFDYKRHFPELYQLLIPSWGSGFSNGTLGNQMSFQIGVMNLTAVLATAIIFIVLLFKRQRIAALLGFFLLFFFLVFFLMLPVSIFLWDTLPLFTYFQFPWRFLSLAILFTSFLAGAGIYIFKKRTLVQGVIIFLTLIISYFLTKDYAKPSHYFVRDDNYYVSRSNFIDGRNSPGDVFNTKWAQQITQRKKLPLTISEDAGFFKSLTEKTSLRLYFLDLKKNQTIPISTLYFPGWKAFLDSEEISLELSKNGSMAVFVPQGKHELRLKFGNTPVRNIGEALSLLSIGIIAIGVLRDTMRKALSIS